MTVIKENLYRCLASKPEEPIFDYPSNKYNDFANILQESFICMTSKNASAVRFADAKQVAVFLFHFHFYCAMYYTPV